ncbi:F-box/WD repeat-containing protein 8-like [Mya arenaria]|uniref:F-box/WD repeat-containing protein 8-like n=1 Tax=Mya arenaria TaxID=6604 RepID=UPI0022E20BB4|nr:F-box/WD repeat-containing protein 8-like [Mya arenaria]
MNCCNCCYCSSFNWPDIMALEPGKEDLLETFRKTWQQELESEPISKRMKYDKQDDPLAQASKESNDHFDLKVSIGSEVCNTRASSAFDSNHDVILKNFKPASESKEHTTVVSTAATAGHSGEKHIESYSKRRQLKKLSSLKLEEIFVERQSTEVPSERLLDKLISDIDEITEIPFFDISLPREVAVKIFQFLSVKDLCSCAQVSSSWRSLAEDELLWCQICHRLGQEKIYTTREKSNWKQIVQHNVERQLMLVANWKNYNGKLTKLEHMKGGILTCLHSCDDTVVAGYTNGDVKLWRISGDESCVFQPSSTALLAPTDDTEGTGQTNLVDSVQTAGKVTVAAYTHGNIDIWDMNAGTQPVYTHLARTGHRYTPSINLAPSGDMLVTGYAHFIDILLREGPDSEFNSMQIDTEFDVHHVKLYPSTSRDIPSVIYSKQNAIYMHTLNPQGSAYVGSTSELHNIYGASVDRVDFKVDQSLLGVALGIGSWAGFDDKLTIKLYDIGSGKLLQTLAGHTWLITALNMHESPAHELVTGSADRKVRVYDVRERDPVENGYYHSLPVRAVQMDEWKVVSGSEDGFVRVWDRRTRSKLWEYNNRHPIRYLHFEDKNLIVGNVPSNRYPVDDEGESVTHKRYRGSISIYNFLDDLTNQDIPEVCLSTYDQPEASRYNISLAVPYDALQF